MGESRRRPVSAERDQREVQSSEFYVEVAANWELRMDNFALVSRGADSWLYGFTVST
jgi:hypothetical protein